VQTRKDREGKELVEITKKRACDKWTEDEDNLLRELLGKMTSEKIGEKIGGRNKNGVLKRVKRLGLQNRKDNKCEQWPDSLVESLKICGPTMTAKQFMTQYGTLKDSTYNHAKKFKINFLPYVEWTEDKIEVLRQSKSAKEAAQKLGKDTSTVLRKAKCLGIVLCESRRPKGEAQVQQRDRKPAKRVSVKRPVREERSRLEICPIHHCPVSDWEGHFERLGCRRSEAFREVV